ncbi:MAG: hypothetical protein ACJ73S_13900 [Mycobacteriales bacterium]
MGKVKADVPEEYVRARAVLLDALTALEPHLDAIVLVGAQAVYLRTGTADLAVVPTTTDADIALAPQRLRDEPLLYQAMRAAGFRAGDNPGAWRGPGDVAIDLMVPEALCGGGGRRGARLPVHGNWAARRTRGLEPAVVDFDHHVLGALDGTDPRRVRLAVAGPAALLVAKVTKVGERLATPRRLSPKDGLDVLRLLRATEGGTLASRLRLLARHAVAGPVTRDAVAMLRAHGQDPDGPLSALAGKAVSGLDDVALVAASTAALVRELLDAYDRTAVTAPPSQPAG